MNRLLSAFAGLIFAQSTMAANYQDYQIKQLNCEGFNGVSYFATQLGTGQLKIETYYGTLEKDFYGQSTINKNNALVVEMSSSEKSEFCEYQLHLPLQATVTEQQIVTGKIFKSFYSARVPLGTITCEITLQRAR